MKTSVYQTSDISIATALSLFFPIISIDKQNPHKAQFFFNRTRELETYVSSYWNKELRVEPREFFDQLKALKVRLYANE